MTQEVGWEVPSHRRTVVGASSADGVVWGDEGQMAMFCWRQFNTDCPVGGKRGLAITKQAAALLDAKSPSDSLQADKVSSFTPRMLMPLLLPRLVQLDGSVSRHELHMGTFALMHVRRLGPVKLANRDPVKHPTAFTVPSTPNAAWHARTSAVLRRVSSSEVVARLWQAGGKVERHVPSGEAPCTAHRPAGTGVGTRADPAGGVRMAESGCGFCTSTVPVWPGSVGTNKTEDAVVRPV